METDFTANLSSLSVPGSIIGHSSPTGCISTLDMHADDGAHVNYFELGDPEAVSQEVQAGAYRIRVDISCPPDQLTSVVTRLAGLGTQLIMKVGEA